MCLGSLDLRNVRTIRSALDGCISDLINNHREILCKDPSKDFTRSCFFSAEKVLNTLLRFGAKNSETVLEFENFSGVPVRSIQQYEQGQKNLNRAAAETVVALVKALSCPPEQLII